MEFNTVTDNVSIFKVVYNKLDSSIDLGKYKRNQLLLSNLENDFYSLSKKPEQDLTTNETDLIKQYNKLYELIPGQERIKFIFIGTQNQEVIDILQKIELSRELELDSNEDNIISTNVTPYFKMHFGYIDTIYFTEIKFIPAYFSYNDTVFSIKKQLMLYLNPIIKDTNDIFLTTHRQIRDTHVYMRNIYRKNFIRKNYFDTKMLLNLMSSLGADDIGIEQITNDFKDKKITLNTFLENKNIKQICYNYLLYHILGYKYVTSGKKNIYINPNPYFDLEEDQIFNTKAIKLDNEEENKILNDIGKIQNNTLYLFLGYDLIDFVRGTGINSLDNEGLQKIFFKTIFRKYFPSYDDYKAVDNIYKDELPPKIDELNDIFSYSQKITKTLNANFKLNRLNIYPKNITNFTLSYPFYSLQISNEVINLQNIFNYFKLDNNVPFVKMKDPLSKEVIFKLYKPAYVPEDDNRLAFISRDMVTKWLKNETKEYDGNKENVIKIVSKGLTFKIFIGLFDRDDIILKGKIIKINDNNTCNILYSEPNKIEFNVPNHFIQEEDLLVSRDVGIKQHEPLFLNFTINHNGTINIKLPIGPALNTDIDILKKIVSNC